jgi:hypothetical protein
MQSGAAVLRDDGGIETRLRLAAVVSLAMKCRWVAT